MSLVFRKVGVSIFPCLFLFIANARYNIKSMRQKACLAQQYHAQNL